MKSDRSGKTLATVSDTDKLSSWKFYLASGKTCQNQICLAWRVTVAVGAVANGNGVARVAA